MMSKISPLSNIVNILTSALTINSNNAKIEDAFDNTVSRDGSSPNQMESDLDMNSNDIINVASLDTTTLKISGSEVTSVISVPDWEGEWVTGTTYGLNDLARNDGDVYICTQAHTAGTFSTDLGSGFWELFASKGSAGAGSGDLLAANNLSDVADPDAALVNLGGTTSAVSLFKGVTGSKANPSATSPTVPDGVYTFITDGTQEHKFLSNAWGYQEVDTDGNYSGSFPAGKIPGGQTRLARTLTAQNYHQANHQGYGDFYNLHMTQAASRHDGFANIVYWSGANSTGMMGGQVNASTDDVTLYGLGDLVLNDQGQQDVSMLGHVNILYYDGTESGDYELPRFNFLASSLGANSVDFAYGVNGNYVVGLDLSQGTYSSSYALTLGESQRLGFDATAAIDGKFGTATGGTYYLEKPAGNYLNMVVDNHPTYNFYKDSLRFSPQTSNAATMRVYSGPASASFLGMGQIGNISYIGAWNTTTSDTQLLFQTAASGVERETMRIKSSGVLNVSLTPEYSDNAAALSGGLVAGDIYHTAAGDLKVVV